MPHNVPRLRVRSASILRSFSNILGLEVDYKKTSEFAMPAELKEKLDGSRALKTAFEALTPGRQRGYILYFSAAKQSNTRAARVEKCVPQILKGEGLNDR